MAKKSIRRRKPGSSPSRGRFSKPFGRNSSPSHRSPSHGAFTLIELLVVVAVTAILASFLLPSLARAKEKAWRVNCVNNLRQIVIAYRVFALDRDGYFPWHTDPSEGGTYGTAAGEGWRNGQAISNEIVKPRLLRCPSDAATKPTAFDWSDHADGFANSANQNNALSYFTGLDGYEQIPVTLVAGDRNITGSVSAQCESVCPSPGVAARDLNKQINLVAWTNGIHSFQGNIALSDASVQKAYAADLRLLAEEALAAIMGGSERAPNGALPDNHILFQR